MIRNTLRDSVTLELERIRDTDVGLSSDSDENIGLVEPDDQNVDPYFIDFVVG